MSGRYNHEMTDMIHKARKGNNRLLVVRQKKGRNRFLPAEV